MPCDKVLGYVRLTSQWNGDPCHDKWDHAWNQSSDNFACVPHACIINHTPLYTSASKALADECEVTSELYLWSAVPYVNYTHNYLFIKM